MAKNDEQNSEFVSISKNPVLFIERFKLELLIRIMKIKAQKKLKINFKQPRERHI